MGRVAEVLEFTRLTTDYGANVAEVKCDLGGESLVTALYYAPPGDDAHPLPGDYAVLVPGGGSGAWIAVGFMDPLLAGEAGPGERIIYSRSAPGVIAAKIHLKTDGSVVVNGSVTITPTGAIEANGEVTAMASGPGVTLSQHTHLTGLGPSSPPTSGT